jgi:hypothetical protein
MSNNDFQFFTQDEAVEVEISNEKIIVINGGGDLEELEEKINTNAKNIDENAKNISELQKTAIIEIPKTAVDWMSTFTISKTGRYFLYAKFNSVDTTKDSIHAVELTWVDENLEHIEMLFLKTDINHTDYVFLPIDVTRIPDGAVYLLSGGSESEVHLFEETVLADVLSETFENTDRRFKEIQSALGSYINDAYTAISEANALLGGYAE